MISNSLSYIHESVRLNHEVVEALSKDIITCETQSITFANNVETTELRHVPRLRRNLQQLQAKVNEFNEKLKTSQDLSPHQKVIFEKGLESVIHIIANCTLRLTEFMEVLYDETAIHAKFEACLSPILKDLNNYEKLAIQVGGVFQREKAAIELNIPKNDLSQLRIMALRNRSFIKFIQKNPYLTVKQKTHFLESHSILIKNINTLFENSKENDVRLSFQDADSIGMELRENDEALEYCEGLGELVEEYKKLNKSESSLLIEQLNAEIEKEIPKIVKGVNAYLKKSEPLERLLDHVYRPPPPPKVERGVFERMRNGLFK